MKNTEDIEINLIKLFENWTGVKPFSIKKLPHSGSNRTYFRLRYSEQTAIGVYNENKDENIAFLDFTRQFHSYRLNIPEVYSVDLNNNIYLIQDFGDKNLLLLLLEDNECKFSNNVLEIYKQVIRELVRFQIIAGRDFDYSKCHQHPVFNQESIIYDLNYFKTKYTDALGLTYNQNKLEEEFSFFADYLMQSDNKYFMYRDFQARNIILMDHKPCFIDYQGGRKGPLQYDLVSLLFQAKAQIPDDIKVLLRDFYIKEAKLLIPIDEKMFIEFYYAFALIRVLQTLGAYGLRGLVEKKSHFIESIPLAKRNLVYLKDKIEILNMLPELNHLINKIISDES